METFETNWIKNQSRIYRYLNRCTNDKDEAKDLLQEVAIKAFLGYESLNDKKKFSFWIFTIATNVFNEYYRKKLRENDTMQDLKNTLELSENHQVFKSEELSFQYQNLFKEMLKTNWVNTKKPFLNEIDYEIVRLKLENPESTSKELAPLIGIKSIAFDVRFSRLSSNIRTYCFLNRPDVLGGITKIRKKLSEVQSIPPPLLNEIEFQIFNSYVIEKNYNIAPKGWREILKEACNKVSVSK